MGFKWANPGQIFGGPTQPKPDSGQKQSAITQLWQEKSGPTQPYFYQNIYMMESEFMNQHVNIYLLLALLANTFTITISLTKTELLLCQSECFLNATANDACPFLQLIISVLNYYSANASVHINTTLSNIRDSKMQRQVPRRLVSEI